MESPYAIDFLSVINSDILSRTVLELSQPIVQIWTLCVSDPPWRLGTMYDVHLGLIRKRVVDKRRPIGFSPFLEFRSYVMSSLAFILHIWIRNHQSRLKYSYLAHLYFLFTSNKTVCLQLFFR